MSFLSALLERLSDVLAPVCGVSATAVAVVVFTMAVRSVLHPLARAAVRGERVRARLAPQMAELQRRFRRDPDRLRRAVSELQAREGASPVAGCLPTVLQLPVFFAMYHLFTRDGALVGESLLGAPLDGRWPDAVAVAGVTGAPSLVFAGLLAVAASVATWSYVRTRRLSAASSAAVPGSPAVARFLPLLSFGTLVTVAVVPLAVSLYVVTTTAWTVVERAALAAGRPVGESADRPAGAGPRT